MMQVYATNNVSQKTNVGCTDALDTSLASLHGYKHGHFTWREDFEKLDDELFTEGVVRLGSLSDEYMSTLDDFIKSQTFEGVLEIGAARREDLLNDAQGECLCSQWVDWMRTHGLVYSHASVLTAFHTDGDHQYWHRDTPDDEPAKSCQVTILVYMTQVTFNNGATQFRRTKACDEVIFDGSRGTVVAYMSGAVLHRGLANREIDPRVMLFIMFDAE